MLKKFSVKYRYEEDDEILSRELIIEAPDFSDAAKQAMAGMLEAEKIASIDEIE